MFILFAHLSKLSSTVFTSLFKDNYVPNLHKVRAICILYPLDELVEMFDTERDRECGVFCLWVSLSNNDGSDRWILIVTIPCQCYKAGSYPGYLPPRPFEGLFDMYSRGNWVFCLCTSMVRREIDFNLSPISLIQTRRFRGHLPHVRDLAVSITSLCVYWTSLMIWIWEGFECFLWRW